MKYYIHFFLFTVDAMTFIQSIVQFTYYGNYELGTIIAIICGILNIYLYMNNKINSFQSFIKNNFSFMKELDDKCKLFKTSCIIYVCLQILICFLGSTFGGFVLLLVFWIFLPLIFSVYSVIFSWVNQQNSENLAKIYGIAICFPSLFILVGGIFSISSFFDFILVIFGALVIYLPSYFISLFTIVHMLPIDHK